MENTESNLNRWGYSQELNRKLGAFSNFAISFSVISILTGSITLYGYGLQTAGPFGVVFGWLLISFASIPLALSMAELASAFPTAGSLYHWANSLGNKHLGWFTAWFNYLGQFAITAGIDYGLAEFLQALLELPPTPFYRQGLFAMLLFSHALINHYGIAWVELFNKVSAWYHVAGVVVVLAFLYWLAPHQPVSFLFNTSNTSGYFYPYAFAIGLLQAQWTISGYDASAHMSEETMGETEAVPQGILMAVVSSGVLGWFLLLGITLSIQNLEAAQSASNPFIYIMVEALGQKLGLAMVWLCVIAMWFCGLSSLTSNSRMLYAFARDKGVPFYAKFAKVSDKHKVPVLAIWVSAILAFGLSFYSSAYDVMIAMSTILLFMSYLIPFFLAARAEKKGHWKEKGKFNLGRYSYLCHSVSSFWVALVIGIFILPPHEKALYATLICTLFLAVFYLVKGKNQFSGMHHKMQKTN